MRGGGFAHKEIKMLKLNDLVKDTQSTTILGIIGIMSELASLLNDVPIGGLITHIFSLTYGQNIANWSPFIIYSYLILFDEDAGKK